MKIESKKMPEKIKYWRTKSNLSKEQLANEADCSKDYIWKLENGLTVRPSAGKIYNISKALGITVEHLLDDNSNYMTDSDFDRERLERTIKELEF